MPEGWAWERIGNVLELINGRAYKKPELLSKGKYRVLRVGNFFTNDSWYFSDLELEDNKYCYDGDLLYAWSASFGPKIWTGDKTIFHYHIWNVRFDEKLFSKFFLYYFLLKDVDTIKESTSGSTMVHVSMENMKPRFICIPPLAEQQRIVSIIENIFSHIDTVEQNKFDLQTEIKQAKMKILDLAIHGKLVPQDPNDEPAEELLKRIATSDNRPYEKVDEEPFEIPDSWKWVKLNDLAEIARGGSPRPIQDYITEDKDGINWIKIGDTIEESKYITSAKEKIKPEGKKHSRFVHAGDFLLTNSMSFGRPYILKIDGCIHDGWLVFANIKECLLQDYLYYALSSAYIYETFSNVAAGSTVKNLKSDTVKQVDFPLPPLSEQKRIVEAIENMYEVLDQIQNNLV